jgi:hypothetical protein
MRSLGKGSLSATTQVKVLSPENILIALGQGFHFLETNIRLLARGESISDVPGSESVVGKRTVYIGTWESLNVPCEGNALPKQGQVRDSNVPVTKVNYLTFTSAKKERDKRTG